MQAMRHWLAVLLLAAQAAASGDARAQAYPFPEPGPVGQVLPRGEEPMHCPGLPRLLNSARLLQTVDLINVRRFYDAHGQDCAWSAPRRNTGRPAFQALAASWQAARRRPSGVALEGT